MAILDDYADLSKDMETAANLLQSVSLKGSSVSQVSDSGPPSGPASQKLDQEVLIRDAILWYFYIVSSSRVLTGRFSIRRWAI